MRDNLFCTISLFFLRTSAKQGRIVHAGMIVNIADFRITAVSDCYESELMLHFERVRARDDNA